MDLNWSSDYCQIFKIWIFASHLHWPHPVKYHKFSSHNDLSHWRRWCYIDVHLICLHITTRQTVLYSCLALNFCYFVKLKIQNNSRANGYNRESPSIIWWGTCRAHARNNSSILRRWQTFGCYFGGRHRQKTVSKGQSTLVMWGYVRFG